MWFDSKSLFTYFIIHILKEVKRRQISSILVSHSVTPTYTLEFKTDPVQKAD